MGGGGRPKAPLMCSLSVQRELGGGSVSKHGA